MLCEDVRCEFNGMQTLVGVLNVIPNAETTDQLHATLHLDALVQRRGRLIPLKNCGSCVDEHR